MTIATLGSEFRTDVCPRMLMYASPALSSMNVTLGVEPRKSAGRVMPAAVIAASVNTSVEIGPFTKFSLRLVAVTMISSSPPESLGRVCCAGSAGASPPVFAAVACRCTEQTDAPIAMSDTHFLDVIVQLPTLHDPFFAQFVFSKNFKLLT